MRRTRAKPRRVWWRRPKSAADAAGRRHPALCAAPENLSAERARHVPHASNGRCWSSRSASIICCRSCAGTAARTRPSQAVLIDLPDRRFYFFFIEIWPQEVYYLTGLLILAAIGLFLMNARRRPRLVRLSLPADGVDRSVLRHRALGRRRPPRAHAARRRASGRSRPVARKGAQAFPLADGRLVDRRRLGALFRRRADAGEGSRDRRRRRSSPMPGSASSPSRPIRSPATCASRSASTCARGRASRRR